MNLARCVECQHHNHACIYHFLNSLKDSEHLLHYMMVIEKKLQAKIAPRPKKIILYELLVKDPKSANNRNQQSVATETRAQIDIELSIDEFVHYGRPAEKNAIVKSDSSTPAN